MPEEKGERRVRNSAASMPKSDVTSWGGTPVRFPEKKREKMWEKEIIREKSMGD